MNRDLAEDQAYILRQIADLAAGAHIRLKMCAPDSKRKDR